MLQTEELQAWQMLKKNNKKKKQKNIQIGCLKRYILTKTLWQINALP